MKACSQCRRLLDGVLAQYEAEVVPAIPQLPCQVHGATNLRGLPEAFVKRPSLSSWHDLIQGSLDGRSSFPPSRPPSAAAHQQSCEKTLAAVTPRELTCGGKESNVLGDDASPGRAARVTGILDFGDFGHSWRVAEPAILLLYVMLLAADPLAAALATLVRSLHRLIS